MTLDILPPGSHAAPKVWFPNGLDLHEEVSQRIVVEDKGLNLKLKELLGETGVKQLRKMMREHKAPSSIPKWTWQLVTGGGWNTDNGDWVPRDSTWAGVNYGHYERPIILKNLCLTPSGEIAIREACLGALESFFIARKLMYENVYFHRTNLVSEALHKNIGRRANELFREGKEFFADNVVKTFLKADEINQVPITAITMMTEAVWQYHLQQWSEDKDFTLKTLSTMLLQRNLHKVYRRTVDKNDSTTEDMLKDAVIRSGYDPKYFLLKLEKPEVNIQKDIKKALKVKVGNDKFLPLGEAQQVFKALMNAELKESESYFAMPMKSYSYLNN